MNSSTERDAYVARCGRVAQAARAAGLQLRKALGGQQALEIAKEGRAVTFPIVSDEADWRQTTPEEALYAVLLDVHDWASVHLDDATARSLDDAERSSLPIIRQDIDAESGRLQQLAAMLGGQTQLQALFATAELTPTA